VYIGVGGILHRADLSMFCSSGRNEVFFFSMSFWVARAVLLLLDIYEV